MDIPNYIEVIQTTFQVVIDRSTEIHTKLDDMTQKKNALTQMYHQLLNENSSIVGTLDIFNFQIKLLNNDLTYLMSKYDDINNRMYSQYYKLWKSVHDYLKQNLPSIPLNTIDYPVYDDTNPSKQYDFKLICDVHYTICAFLKNLIHHLHTCNEKYIEYKTINNSGVHIDIFVDTYKYNVMTIIEKMSLFSVTMKFYNTTNVCNYTKLVKYIDYIHDDASSDISFNNIKDVIREEPTEENSVCPVQENITIKDDTHVVDSEPTSENTEIKKTAEIKKNVHVLANYFDSITLQKKLG